MTIHDEGGMRHFYAEWSRRMGRKAYEPFGERKWRRSLERILVVNRSAAANDAEATCRYSSTESRSKS